MDSDRWTLLQHLFEQARALAPEARAAFVAAGCPDDAALRTQLLALLAADTSAAGVEGDPASQALGRAARHWIDDRRQGLVGQRLGAWRISAHLADGGMGAVYRAERDDGQYEQSAAIKLINPAFVSPMALQRLATERQILARLEHPGIARLLEGGTTEDGAPYLVMELVDGTPIDAYCRRQRLEPAARLRLVIEICAAVEHAHRKLVVHRDLKPANILVDRQGRPRLLDFGIAKLLAADGPQMQATQRLLTPTHASPEQILGQDVSTATDVYSLGVLLYQLLAGRPPFERAEPATDGDAALMRRIVEETPAPPSTAAGDRGVARFLRGDLDTIVLMALRKEPARRYASVADLADDLRRHLGHLPVRARPDSLAYRGAKFVRRHPVAVPVSVAASAALVVLVSAFTWRLAGERDRATLAAEQSSRVAQFMSRVFEGADSTRSLGKTLTARELLDSGARQIDRELAAEPAVAAALRSAMGDAYRNLGFYAEAHDLHHKAWEDNARLFGADSAAALRSRIEWGRTLRLLARFDDAQAQLQGAVDALRQPGRTDAVMLARALLELAEVHRGRLTDFALAERSFREAIDGARAAGPAADEVRAEAMHGLGGLWVHTARYDEARPLLEEALALRRKRRGDADPATLESLRGLGVLALRQTRQADALPIFEQVLSLSRRVYGDEHVATGNAMNDLANALAGFGQPARAETLLREALAVFRKRLGDEHPRVAFTRENLANALFNQARFTEAIGMYRASLQAVKAAFGDRHPEYGLSLYNIAGAYRRLARHDEATRHYHLAIPILRQAFGRGYPMTVAAFTGLAASRSLARDLRGAEAALDEAEAEARDKLAWPQQELINLRNQRGWVLLEQGRPAEAEPLFRATLEAQTAKDQGARGRRIADEQAGLGATLAALRRHAEAEALLKASHDALSELLGPQHEDVRKARARLLALYRAWGRPDQVKVYAAPPAGADPGPRRSTAPTL